MTEKFVSARFGPGPFSLEGIAELIRALGEVDDDDLRPLAAKLGVAEDSFHVKAAADVLGISNEPRELPELYSLVRRLLRTEAPVTVVFEEVGAAGPAFFNLVTYLEDALEDDSVIIELRGEEEATYPMPDDGHALADAGLRALGRSDMPAADAFLSAAVDRLPSGDERFRCMAARCDALLAGGLVDDAMSVATAGLEEAVRDDNERFRARFTFFTTVLGDGSDDLDATMSELAATLTAAGDRAGAALATETRAHVTWDRGDEARAVTTMEEALEHARAAGDVQTTTRIVAWLCDVAASSADAASGRERVAAWSWVGPLSPLVEVKRLATLALLEARCGAISSARSNIEVAAALQEDLGQPAEISGVPEVRMEIERLASALSQQTTTAEDV